MTSIGSPELRFPRGYGMTLRDADAPGSRASHGLVVSGSLWGGLVS